MRILFFGTSEFAVPSLKRLVASGQRIVACVTQPDRPQGRGLGREPSPVKRAALALGIPLSQPERPDASRFAALQAEVGVVAAYGELIRRDLLQLPAHGMLGVHPSLLPKYRGAAPIAWAILNGETTTGVTIFQLNERLDAGDMLIQEPLTIEPGERASALTARLAERSAEALVRAVELIASGRATYTPQDDAQASLAPKFTKTQGHIEWTEAAVRIERLIRATDPWPGAATIWRGEPLKICQAAVAQSSHEQAPGAIAQVTPDAIIVACGEGAVAISEVQAPGKRRMRVREFLAGHPIKVGDVFGAGDRGQETGGWGTPKET